MHAEVFPTYAGRVSRDLSVVGRALSAPARSAIVTLLMDGSTRPASELAAAAGVSASTASEHLAVLVEAGLLTSAARGRQRFYAIAGQDVAGALEELGRLCPSVPVTSYRRSALSRRLAGARLCCDHVAGRLGVDLAQSLVAAGWVVPDLSALTPEGSAGLTAWGVDIDALRRGRRPMVRACADWTERRSHLAGATGAAIATLLLERRWVVRAPAGRGLDVTVEVAAAAGRGWAEFARRTTRRGGPVSLGAAARARPSGAAAGGSRGTR